jgi:hypothetical protein
MLSEEAHDHCFHPYQGPIMQVVPDGHVVLKCCKCDAKKVVHKEHIR